MSQCKLLLVDDEVEFVNTLGERLSMRGIDVLIAHSGAEALQIVEEQRPQIIILDLMMPGLSGLETLRRIKAISSHIQVILLTGIGSSTEGTQGLTDGAFAYLVKPLQIEELMKKIEEAAVLCPGKFT